MITAILRGGGTYRGGGELPEGDGLWCCPPDGDLAAPRGVGPVHRGLRDLPAHTKVKVSGQAEVNKRLIRGQLVRSLSWRLEVI